MRTIRLPLALALALALPLSGCKVEVLCAAGQTPCGDRCVSTDLDAANCGGCGVRCRSHEECDAGACTGAPGTTLCAGAWVDLATDPAHCGGCAGAACAPGQSCRADAGGCAGACPPGLASCGGACVDHATDRFHCGTCGNECRRGESCRDAACVPDLYVACFATDDVRPMSAALRGGIPLPAGDGPVFLAVDGPRLHVSSTLSHSITTFPSSLRETGYEHLLGRGDLENVTVHAGRVYASNSDAGTLVVMRSDTGEFVDEVVLSPRAGSNPRAVAFVGDVAFVALGGRSPESGGHEVAVVDFSGPRGVVTARLPVGQLAPEGAIPSPTGVVAIGTKVYVTIANLALGYFGYTDPAGPSKLAVIDAAVDPPVLTSVDLGPDCRNAGGIAAEGTRLWIGCSWTDWSTFESHPYLLPVETAAGSPVPGTALSTAPSGVFGPWSIAFCRGMGYVTDGWSGSVLRFDPSGATSVAVAAICPTGPAGFAFASAVACAP